MLNILKVFPFTAGPGRDIFKSVALRAFEVPGRGTDLLTVWEKRLSDRKALSTMDSHLLDDMGITPEDAARETAKPFWRA